MSTHRVTSTVTSTTVRHIAEPMGKERESGPHLADLRTFVASCEGLPDNLLVRITHERLDESGRNDVTFEATHRVTHDEPQATIDGEPLVPRMVANPPRKRAE